MLEIMNQIIDLFSYDFARIALLGSLLVALISGILSPLVVLKQRAYVGDLVAHYIFPGVVASYLLASAFDLPKNIVLIVGAGSTALIGSFMSEFVTKKLKAPSDAISIVALSGFFALGALILSQKQGVKVNLELFLFGDILSLNYQDLIILGIALVVSLLAIFILKEKWEAWLCDPEFAMLSGCPIKLLERLFVFLITFVVLASLFTVGSLMITALLALPAVLVRPKTILDSKVILVSVSLSLVGFVLSLGLDTPIGATIVVFGLVLVVCKAIMIKRR